VAGEATGRLAEGLWEMRNELLRGQGGQ